VPTPTLAHVNPQVLRWARESVGYTAQAAAAKLGVYTWQVEAAERGEDLLTLRQAERLAEFYDRPLATLFLPTPPDEEPAEAQFRRLPGAPPPPWPPEMNRLIRRVRARQEAAAELYDLLDEAPPWGRPVSELAHVDRRALASVMRQRLGVSFDQQAEWNDPAGYTGLRAWVDAVEAQGVLVMQDGSMPLDSMRGFASTHAAVPAVVVNTRDDPRSRAFTVIHELGHLALAATGASVGLETETWCNEFAGELIVPHAELSTAFQKAAGDPERRIAQVALVFGVTPLAAAVRIARERSPGGNYYRNKITWLGPAFVRLVLEAADGQALTLSNAAGLLEAKVNHFHRLRETLDRRAEFG
jgi:Zn-dependent peptidase ImmA (M78 family)